MGRVAYQSLSTGSVVLHIGQAAAAQGKGARIRHRTCSWKHLGRPPFLPAPVPLERPGS